MANENVDRLIAELSAILEQNRQKRQQTDAAMLGAQQAQRATSGNAVTQNEQQRAPEFRSDAGSISPSTTSAGRVKLAERYNFLKDNDTPAPPPTDAGALEEQKKRFTQRLMMERGQTGGPLGGAGQPAPQPDPQIAALEAAGNPDLGNFGNITRDTFAGGTGGAPPMAAAAAPPPNDDMALLDALSQRYISPEELARR